MANSCLNAKLINKACLNDKRQEAKRRRRKSVDFAKAKRVFKPFGRLKCIFCRIEAKRLHAPFSMLPYEKNVNRIQTV